MKNIFYILIILSLISIPSYAQYSEEKIITDSSEIQIIRNSVYRIFEETYKNKDSIWYSVRYIEDTTQVHTEGWKTKDNKYLGIWKEFTFDGKLLYTWDHDNNICEVNKSLHPFHDLLKEMKTKADNLIISAYGKDFFNHHVRFKFKCSAYDEDGYVGSWTEPMNRKPTEFLFRYDVKLDSSENYENMIGIELDEYGENIPKEGLWQNRGFENIQSNNKLFNIDRQRKMEIAKDNGLILNDSSNIHKILKWESFNRAEFYNGEFKYYIMELVDVVEYERKDKRYGFEYKYNVYSFNPWTGSFIEKKRMKRVEEFGKHSGFSTCLIPDE